MPFSRLKVGAYKSPTTQSYAWSFESQSSPKPLKLYGFNDARGLRGNFSYRHGPLDEIYNKVLG